jgi:hypothetical protein
MPSFNMAFIVIALSKVKMIEKYLVKINYFKTIQFYKKMALEIGEITKD